MQDAPRAVPDQESRCPRRHLNCHLVTIVTTVDVSADMEGYRWASAEPWTASTLLAAVGLRR